MLLSLSRGYCKEVNEKKDSVVDPKLKSGSEEKKMNNYESPKVEVITFHTSETIMDSGCTGYQAPEIGCVVDYSSEL